MKKFDYYQPEKLKEALGLMEKMKGNARYVAGGTDILCRIKQKLLRPDALISLRGIRALRGITPNGGLSLGSMTRFRELERDFSVARDYPGLAQAVWVLANPQIRNVATIGGNLCNAAPSADTAPPLMVMEANLIIEGPGGWRKVPIQDFFKGPGQNCMEGAEILTQIQIPKKEPRTGVKFLKIGRVSQDIAVANAAALVVMEGKICRKCRLAVGAVAPVPLRLTAIEKMVEGEEISADLLDRVGKMVEEQVAPISDVRSTEVYRRQVTGALVTRAIRQALDEIG